jgi:heme oxygenase
MIYRYSAITAGGQILRSRLVKHLLFFTPTDELQPSLPKSALHLQYTLNGQQLFDFYPVANTQEDVEDWRLECPISRKRLRTELKRRLDALTLSPSEIDAIIDEANYIFATNAKVLSEASDGAGWYLLQWALTWSAITAAVTATTVWLLSIWKR